MLIRQGRKIDELGKLRRQLSDFVAVKQQQLKRHTAEEFQRQHGNGVVNDRQRRHVDQLADACLQVQTLVLEMISPVRTYTHY